MTGSSNVTTAAAAVVVVAAATFMMVGVLSCLGFGHPIIAHIFFCKDTQTS